MSSRRDAAFSGLKRRFKPYVLDLLDLLHVPPPFSRTPPVFDALEKRGHTVARIGPKAGGRYVLIAGVLPAR